MDYSSLALPKPEPRRRTKARATRQRAQQIRTTRAAVFAREAGICRCCGRRAAESMHELIFRSRGGAVSTSNSVAVCGSGTTGCHGRLQTHRITVEGPMDADRVLYFVPATDAAAAWLAIPLGRQIRSGPREVGR